MKLNTISLKYSVRNVFGVFIVINIYSQYLVTPNSLQWWSVLQLYLISVVRVMASRLSLKQVIETNLKEICCHVQGSMLESMKTNSLVSI